MEHAPQCDQIRKADTRALYRANNYQFEESETWIGEWMAERKNRHEIVLATKFTMYFPGPKTAPRIGANHTGNSAKSLRVSVEASLKKLQTEYIDLLYLHWWDFTTSVGLRFFLVAHYFGRERS